MIVYIASSWKNQHAVEMMTDLLEGRGHEVLCFVRQEHAPSQKQRVTFEKWVRSDDAAACFTYDTVGATQSDVVLYISPSGTDAWAEVGAAWAAKVPIVGLWAKEEQAGLMRYMVTTWCDEYKAALDKIDSLKEHPQ